MANLKNLKVSKISYDAILEKAMATSGGVATTSYANGTATATAAPYLPRIVSAGETDLDGQCQAFVAKTTYTYEEARLFWNTLMACVAEVLNDGVHTSVEFGYFRFALEVAGSVPSANSAPDPLNNPVWIAVYPSAELQAVAASIETMPNIASQPFQLKEVFGHDHAPNRVTTGQQMLVMGVNLTMGGTGEKVELAKGTTVAACTYVPRAGDLNTRIRATVPSSLTKGKGYTLLVTAKGKNGTELMTLSKQNIEVVEGPPTPVFTSATSDGCETGTVEPNSTVTVVGTGLKGVKSTDKIRVTFPLMEGEASVEGTNVTVAADGLSLTFDLGDKPTGAVDGDGSVVLAHETGGAAVASVVVNIEV